MGQHLNGVFRHGHGTRPKTKQYMATESFAAVCTVCFLGNFFGQQQRRQEKKISIYYNKRYYFSFVSVDCFSLDFFLSALLCVCSFYIFFFIRNGAGSDVATDIGTVVTKKPLLPIECRCAWIIDERSISNFYTYFYLFYFSTKFRRTMDGLWF